MKRPSEAVWALAVYGAGAFASGWLLALIFGQTVASVIVWLLGAVAVACSFVIEPDARAARRARTQTPAYDGDPVAGGDLGRRPGTVGIDCPTQGVGGDSFE